MTTTTDRAHRVARAPRAPARAADGPAYRTIRALLGKAIADRLRVAVIAGFYMVLMGVFVGALWSPMQDALASFPPSFLEAFRGMLVGGDLTTPAGWANAEMMSMVAPAGVITAAILSASRATAGEEEDRTLGLLLSAPVSRTTFIVTKLIAMVVHVLIVAGFVAAGLGLGSVIGDLGLSVVGIVAASLHLAALGVLFGAVAALIGGLAGHRRLASVGAAVLAVVAWSVNSFFPLSETLAESVKYFPWHYVFASNPLVNGFDLSHVALLLASSLLPAVAAVLSFRRRDLRG